MKIRLGATASVGATSYNCYFGSASGVYNAPGSPTTIAAGSIGDFTVDTTTEGLLFFALKAIGDGGESTLFSNEVYGVFVSAPQRSSVVA